MTPIFEEWDFFGGAMILILDRAGLCLVSAGAVRRGGVHLAGETDGTIYGAAEPDGN